MSLQSTAKQRQNEQKHIAWQNVPELRTKPSEATTLHCRSMGSMCKIIEISSNFGVLPISQTAVLKTDSSWLMREAEKPGWHYYIVNSSKCEFMHQNRSCVRWKLMVYNTNLTQMINACLIHFLPSYLAQLGIIILIRVYDCTAIAPLCENTSRQWISSGI